MPGMTASNRNRSRFRVDNPNMDDGFYQDRHFKRSRKGGAATGGRGWRRKLRKKEAAETQRIIREEQD
jgi:hypothetical protein